MSIEKTNDEKYDELLEQLRQDQFSNEAELEREAGEATAHPPSNPHHSNPHPNNENRAADSFAHPEILTPPKVEPIPLGHPQSPRLEPTNDLAALTAMQVFAETNTQLQEHGHAGMNIFAFPAPYRLGRPQVLNEHSKLIICQLLQMGLSRRQASVYVRCAASTITRTIQRDAYFAEEVERSEMMCTAIPRMLVFKAAKKSWRAAAWLDENSTKLEKSRQQEDALDAKAQPIEKNGPPKREDQVNVPTREPSRETISQETPVPCPANDSANDSAKGGWNPAATPTPNPFRDDSERRQKRQNKKQRRQKKKLREQAMQSRSQSKSAEQRR